MNRRARQWMAWLDSFARQKLTTFHWEVSPFSKLIASNYANDPMIYMDFFFSFFFLLILLDLFSIFVFLICSDDWWDWMVQREILPIISSMADTYKGFSSGHVSLQSSATIHKSHLKTQVSLVLFRFYFNLAYTCGKLFQSDRTLSNGFDLFPRLRKKKILCFFL